MSVRRTAGDGTIKKAKAVVWDAGDGTKILHDPDNHDAWIRSTITVPEGDLQ